MEVYADEWRPYDSFIHSRVIGTERNQNIKFNILWYQGIEQSSSIKKDF